MGVLTSAEGQAPARARRGGALSFRWRALATPPAEESASSGGIASLSAFGVLGLTTLAVLGMSTAGIDLIRPAAARGVPLPLGVVAAETALAAGTVTAEMAPASAILAVPARMAMVFPVPEAPRRDVHRPAAADRVRPPTPMPLPDREAAAWRQAMVVPDRPVTAVAIPAHAVAPPMPVLKPHRVARVGLADVVPPVVEKPRNSGSTVASLGAHDIWEWRNAPTAAALIARFDSVGYDLAAVRMSAQPVPRLYLDALPHDLASVSPVTAKKRLFVQSVLPVILRVNEELTAARWRVQRLGVKLVREGVLSSAEREWLAATAELYDAIPFDLPDLLSRMDTVPPSLALAQAAEETGWGTSRFVREGNALFGQYTYKLVAGIVPEQRDADRRHRIRRHDNLLAAARAYAHNLNSHSAYEGFRSLRSQLRHVGAPVGGYTLAGELRQYSERRAAYVQSIREIMRQNRLGEFDRAWLNNRQWTAVFPPGGRPI